MTPRAAAFRMLHRTGLYTAHNKGCFQSGEFGNRNVHMDVRRRTRRNRYNQLVDESLAGGNEGLICVIILATKSRTRLSEQG